jgi:hypothetical protein
MSYEVYNSSVYGKILYKDGRPVIVNYDDADKLLQRLMELLQIAKDYLIAAENCCDLNLKKDAYKRIINIYCDISNIQQPSNEEPIVFESIEFVIIFLT